MAITTEVITSWENIKGLKSEWDRLLHESGSDTVFLTLEWLEAWISTIGKSGLPFVVCVRDSGQLVAIAPLILINRCDGILTIRKMQFMGAPNADYSDFVVTGNRAQCLHEIINVVDTNASLWDVLELSHVSNESPNWPWLKEYFMAVDSIHSDDFSICPYVRLDMSWEDYLRSRPKFLAYDIRRGMQRLAQRGQVKYEVFSEQSKAISCLREFYEMLDRRETVTQRKGSTAAKEDFFSFFNRLILDDNSWQIVHFSRLTLNDEAFAYHLGFVHSNKIYWYKPTFDPEFSPFSPGKLIIAEAMNQAISAGFIEFDFLQGEEPYKFQWTENVRQIHGFRSYNSRLRSRLCRSWLEIVRPLLKQNRYLLNLIRKIRRA